MRIMRFALVAVACFILVGLAWAQAAGCTQGVIPVGVIEAEMNYMGMLGREQFRIELNHRQAWRCIAYTSEPCKFSTFRHDCSG